MLSEMQSAGIEGLWLRFCGGLSSSVGRKHLAESLAKSDSYGALALAPAAENHDIPVFKEGPLFASTEAKCVGAPSAELDQRAGLGGRRARLGAAPEQISGA